MESDGVLKSMANYQVPRKTRPGIKEVSSDQECRIYKCDLEN
jgi:hypothetical protein